MAMLSLRMAAASWCAQVWRGTNTDREEQMASPCTRSCFKSELGERDPMQEALAEIEQLKETIRAFGRGDIVPITDKDAEIERLRR
jgi:hypothetical protein